MASSFLLAAAIPLRASPDLSRQAVRIVVPTEPGGSSDTLARLLGGKLQEQWGQPVIVENRAGANQMIGADVVVKSPADGHAILLPTITYTTGAATMPKLPFDPLNDLTGITMIGDGPFMVVVHPSLPVKSMKELIALARARPGQINYGFDGCRYRSPQHRGVHGGRQNQHDAHTLQERHAIGDRRGRRSRARADRAACRRCCRRSRRAGCARSR